MTKRVNESIEVAAPKEDVFAYWSNFENFPEFMQNIEEIRMTGEDTSHWNVKGPLGVSVEFDAKTTVMDPDRGINWESVDGQVMTWGQVRFEPVSEGRTRIEVMMDYADPPGGQAGGGRGEHLERPGEEYARGSRELREDSRARRAWRTRNPVSEQVGSED